MNYYSQVSLKNTIQTLSNLSIDDIEVYYTIMNYYIKKYKYEELITGFR